MLRSFLNEALKKKSPQHCWPEQLQHTATPDPPPDHPPAPGRSLLSLPFPSPPPPPRSLSRQRPTAQSPCSLPVLPARPPHSFRGRRGGTGIPPRCARRFSPSAPPPAASPEPRVPPRPLPQPQGPGPAAEPAALPPLPSPSPSAPHLPSAAPPRFPPRRAAHAPCPLCPGRAGGAGQAGPLQGPRRRRRRRRWRGGRAGGRGAAGTAMVKKRKGRVLIDSDTEDSGSEENLDQVRGEARAWALRAARGSVPPSPPSLLLRAPVRGGPSGAERSGAGPRAAGRDRGGPLESRGGARGPPGEPRPCLRLPPQAPPGGPARGSPRWGCRRRSPHSEESAPPPLLWAGQGLAMCCMW